MPEHALVRRLLVPMDYSQQARAAAVVAGSLAEQLGAQVRFVTVLDFSDLRVALKARLHSFTTNAQVRAAVEEWLRDRNAEVSVPTGVRETRSVRRGDAASQILAEIASWRPQLVVMGSSGLARRLPLGSKTAAILRRSSVPVLVCRAPRSR